MPSKRLGDVAEIVMGQSPPGSSCNSDGRGLPLLNGPTEFGAHHPTPRQFTTDARRRSRKGDLLFCVRGSTTGRMNWSDQEYAIGRGVAAVRHKSDLGLQPLVRGVIEFGLRDLLAQATGSTFPNVSGTQLGEIPFPDIEGDEQLAVAGILGAFDDKIELSRRMNATLEGIARALFKSWFVDFDPVRAKAEGRGTGLPPNLDTLFPDHFEESEAGEIPAGWRVGTIGDAVEVNGGSTPSTTVPEYWDGQYAWATPRDMSSLRAPVLLATSRAITESGLAHISSGLLPRGTVLLSSRAPIGYLAIAGIPVAVNQGIAAMVCRGVVSPAWALNWTFFNMDAIEGRAGGTTFAEISKSNFRSLPAVLPPDELQLAFGTIATPLYERLEANERQCFGLAALRDALLPELMSGRLAVRG